MEIFDKALAWVKANIMIAAGIALVLIILLFGKPLKRLVAPTRRIRRRRPAVTTRRRRSLPRSVGMRKASRPARRQYNKNGKAKKPWQIKGSEAARRHMRRIRQMR